jgi:transposase
MVWKAAKPNVTEKQSKILCEIIDSRTSRHDHIQRAQIIQKSSEGLSDRKIAKLLNIGRIAVATWRNRWLFNESTLFLIDKKEFGISYKNQIFKILSDSPRSGAPPKFSAEQICQIINVACEVPEELDLPLSHWSLSSLSDEIVKRKIVDSISLSQLAVFLKSGEDKTS